MNKLNSNKKAFTMIELIFAIVVLGIVASIVSSIIVQVYKSYTIQRAMHRSGLKVEIAINQIANRLSYRIDKSVRATQPPPSTLFVELNNLDFLKKDDYPILEWIGYDNDGFSTSNDAMGWSGFCDLGNSNFYYITSIGSKPDYEITYLNNIFGATAGSPALYFMDGNPYRENATKKMDYNTTCMYTTAGSGGCMFPITDGGNDTWSFTDTLDRISGQMKYTEFYQLASSAYAIEPKNEHTLSTGLTVWDLHLHSNYQPWNGENFKDDGIDNILIKNVSVFRFNQTGHSIRLKLCVVEVIGGENISMCKEKAVIR